MGELLCPSESTFSKDTLIWSDMCFNSSESVTLNIRHPKSNKAGGEKVEVFAFPEHNCCQVKALRYLSSLKAEGSQGLPVFSLSDGSYLCKKKLNDTLKSLLGSYSSAAVADGG